MFLRFLRRASPLGTPTYGWLSSPNDDYTRGFGSSSQRVLKHADTLPTRLSCLSHRMLHITVPSLLNRLNFVNDIHFHEYVTSERELRGSEKWSLFARCPLSRFWGVPISRSASSAVQRNSTHVPTRWGT